MKMKTKILLSVALLVGCAIGHTLMFSVADISVGPSLAVSTVNGGATERTAQLTYEKRKPLLGLVFPAIYGLGMFFIFGPGLIKRWNVPVIKIHSHKKQQPTNQHINEK